MKTFYLLRHAKAEPKSIDKDFTRRLNPDGIKQVQELAGYWKKKAYEVDFVMCSAAVRTEQTLDGLRPSLNTDNMLISNNFYGIEEDKMLHTIQGLNEPFDNVLWVGHNPGVAFFAMRMAIKAPEPLLKGFSTCSLCAFQINIENWSDLDWHMGEVIDYWSPQEISN